MKSITSLIIAIFVLSLAKSFAQNSATKLSVPQPDASSIVVDSAGTEYAYDDWRRMLSSGVYKLRYRKGKDLVPDQFVL